MTQAIRSPQFGRPQMNRRTIALMGWVGLLLAGGCQPVAPKVDMANLPCPEGIDPRANAALYRASEFLKSADTATYQAIVIRDISLTLHDEVAVKMGGVAQVAFKRPNKVRGTFKGDDRSRAIYFNGEMLTLCSYSKKFYAQLPYKGTTDEALDYLHEDLGFHLAVSDILYADPYAILIENAERGYYVGVSQLPGVECDQLVFQQETVDWQIWIERGDRPFVRQLVVTYKDEPGAPQVFARFSKWQLNPLLSDRTFEFKPGKDLSQIEFLPMEQVNKGRAALEAKMMEEEVVEESDNPTKGGN
jgi:hypothetical protein